MNRHTSEKLKTKLLPEIVNIIIEYNLPQRIKARFWPYIQVFWVERMDGSKRMNIILHSQPKEWFVGNTERYLATMNRITQTKLENKLLPEIVDIIIEYNLPQRIKFKFWPTEVLWSNIFRMERTNGRTWRDIILHS